MNYQFENATVRSDYSVVKKKGYKDIETVDYKNCKVLFHGSKHGLSQIVLSGRNKVDFGSGFYLNSDKKKAESWIAEFDNPTVYMFFADFTHLKVYKFKDLYMWLYFIAYNRNMIKAKRPDKIIKEIKSILTYDVIIGNIADDKMFEVTNMFLDGFISVESLLYCMNYVNLGTQFVLKTQKAVNSLILLNAYKLSSNQSKYYKNIVREQQMRMKSLREEAKRKYRNGRYVDDVLKGV